MCRILPLFCRNIYPTFPPVVNHFHHTLRVTQSIVLTKEEECRSHDRSVPKRVDASVEVVHCLPFKNAEVEQAYLFHQSLPLRKYSLAKT